MNIPVSPWALMSETCFKGLPAARRDLNHWKIQAQQIPNSELRKQALTGLAAKQLHCKCEGGSIYALLAKNHWQEGIRFIVAYQTISDY